MPLASTILIALIIVVAGWFVGTAALTMAYSIPTADMHEALESSSETIQAQKKRPDIDGTRHTYIDTFTDAAMLGFAGIPGQGKAPLTQAMENICPKKADNKWAPQTALKNLVEAGDSYDGASNTYNRYWHGYLVWLKPALAAGFDLDAIHGWQYVLQISLIVAVSVLLALRGRAILVPAFVVVVFCIRGWMVAQCMQYSSVFEIALLASAAYLLLQGIVKTHAGRFRLLVFLFLLTGMLTSFFDLLTYPLFTLGLPLLVALGCREADGLGMCDVLFMLIVACLAWGCGYAVMWAGKWVIASIVLQQNVFENAFSAAMSRSGNEVHGHEIAFRDVVRRNAVHYLEPGLVAMIAIVLAAYVARLCWLVAHGKTTVAEAFRQALPYVLVAIFPFAWYYVLKNHSYMHQFFTYRTLSIAVGAFLFAFAPLVSGSAARKESAGQEESSRVHTPENPFPLEAVEATIDAKGRHARAQ